MKEVNLYPEMNEKIVELLRISDDPIYQYAATLIEKLLREKQEREKGCEYCEVDESGQMRLIWECGLDHFDFELNVCPNCGRKLREN